MKTYNTCTICSKTGMSRYYGNRSGIPVCFSCYQKNRKMKLKPVRSKARVYSMWGE